MAATGSLVIGGLGLAMNYGAAQDTKAAAGRQAAAMESSAAEQRKQFQAQQRIADIKNARERANMVRQQRIARADTISTGALTGTSTSSGVQGGAGSIGTQGAANQGFFSAIQGNQQDIITSQIQQGSYAVEAGQAAGDITQASAQAALGQNLFNLGSNVFAANGGAKSIFDSNNKVQKSVSGMWDN